MSANPGQEMGLSEIASAQINEDVAREAYVQASVRLSDVLDTRKTFDQKAFTLFTGYMTAALASSGVSGAIYKDHGLTALSFSFALAAIALLIGVSLFAFALKDGSYGAMGSAPSMWLKTGIIDDDKHLALPRMLAALTYYHTDRIKVSIDTNNEKARFIRWGIYCGLATPPLLFASILIAKALL